MTRTYWNRSRKRVVREWVEWIMRCWCISWLVWFAVMLVYLWHNSTLFWLIRFGGEWWR